jgi:hypothetical protein
VTVRVKDRQIAFRLLLKGVRELDCPESILPQLQLSHEFISQPTGHFVQRLNRLGNVEPEDECGEFVDGE